MSSYNCEHGQLFDNRKRWCANCNKTVQSAGINCIECSAIWPEYIEEFLESVQDDPNYKAAFGIEETRH